MTPLPSVAPDMRDAGSNSFLLRHIQTLGISLGEMDHLRGHKDDFFGDQINDEYEQETVGAGSTITLADTAHGGWVQLRAGDDPGRYSRLWLGASAGGYNTLDADEGWVQMALIKYPFANTDVVHMMGAAATPAFGGYIQLGLDTAIGANYIIQCFDGVLTTTDSGIAADNAWHWHVADVYPITGGRQVDYYLDGALIAYQTTNVPTTVLTPFGITYNRGTAIRRSDWDYWGVIPRQLV